jgi:putative hemolysin
MIKKTARDADQVFAFGMPGRWRCCHRPMTEPGDKIATMQIHARTMSPRRLMHRFRPVLPVAGFAGLPGFGFPGLGFPGFLPTLRAYSGLRVPQVRIPHASETLGRLGSLEVKLARTAADVRRAQRLRFQVFYQEMSAVADAPTMLARRDVDPFDPICDHVLVIDHNAAPRGPLRKPRVVGTYRMLRQDIAERHDGFYSASEFDIGALVRRHPGLNFLELGRSCVLPQYRNKRTVELLWHGIWTYVLANRLDVMIGCASLEGTDPDSLALPLSFLHHYARAPEEWRASAVPRRYVEMNRMPKSAINPKAALHALPPLVKGYLRLGAFIGDGAVVDRQFGTTDVLMILPVSAIKARYIEHFGATAGRHAA